VERSFEPPPGRPFRSAFLGTRFRTWSVLALAAAALAIGIGPTSKPAISAASHVTFCSRLGHSIEASSGAHLFCDAQTGTRPLGGAGAGGRASSPAAPALAAGTNPVFGNNVDAANPGEDVSPASVQSYGQSETSIAALGPYVVEAWNDATGFATACPAPQSKEELTGFGFSSDGGATFTDQGGLPNQACTTGYRLFGDPSVEAWRHGNKTYFYVSSLYNSIDIAAPSELAINACEASGTTISCGQPVVAARGGCTTDPLGTVCFDFLDKEFLTIDPQRSRLYMSYTNFRGSTGVGSGEIDLVTCDISQPLAPVCSPSPVVVAPEDPICENQGAYPAVDQQSGDVYVAWEFNSGTNIFVPPCEAVPTVNKVARIPRNATAPGQTASVPIVSMMAAFVPGYNRFPGNDFPRIAVSSVSDAQGEAGNASGTVSIVWNDARRVPTGDILLQSFALRSLTKVQGAPVRLNSDTSFTWKFLPALRNATSAGLLNVSWYDRRGQSGAVTNVLAARNVDPRTTSTPANVQVTNTASDWSAVSSDIVPNFGDYTDNYAVGTTLYVAWSDGRLGVPQPFASKLP
jgi:hypothetical protein